jgi:hypothetical protein
MAHVIYDNFYLSNEIEDQFNSHLDLQQFCTVDNSLVGTAGMKRKINRYRATNATQKLTMGNGNTQSIEVSYAQKEYEILLAQNRFEYFDEQEMTDPMLVPVGVRHMGTDMFNTVNADVFAEFNKATQIVVVSAFGFDAFADAQSMFNLENIEGVNFFGFVCPADVAALRKALGLNLQYVEAFARTGYVGTVAGVNIYTKKDAVAGVICIATKEAVTLFNKKGTEVETPQRDAGDANIRKNTILSRKYYIAALTDETKAVKIVKGTASVTADTTVDEDKTYYEASGLGYVEVVPETGDNPKTKGWYEITVS